MPALVPLPPDLLEWVGPTKTRRGTDPPSHQRLLRQYFPKGTSLANVTQADLDVVATKLNTRPRKALGYRTPATNLDEGVAWNG